MAKIWLPIFLFVVVAGLLATGLLAVARLIGPRRKSEVKHMPYESGMDPIHDARRPLPNRLSHTQSPRLGH